MPLDDTCKRACRDHALETYGAAVARDGEDASALAFADLTACLKIAMARHAKAALAGDDADDEDKYSACDGTGEALAKLRSGTVEGPIRAADVVRAAWDAAIAAGAGERVAAERALAAAAPYDDEDHG